MNPTPRANTNRCPEFQYFTDRDGSTIGFRTLGAGSVTVILDAGLQDGSNSWNRVTPEIASFATVLVLDRSWLLRSASSAVVVEPQPAARQIRQLLNHARLRGPFIPVGWAIGSIYARSLAADNPLTMTGLVLVDDVPEQFLREVLDSPHPEATSEYCRAMLVDVDSLVALRGRDVLDTPAPDAPIDLPITHVSRGTRPPEADVVAQRWIQLQRQYLRNATMLREVIAGRSGHAIPTDRPDVIVDAVRDLTLRTSRLTPDSGYVDT